MERLSKIIEKTDFLAEKTDEISEKIDAGDNKTDHTRHSMVFVLCIILAIDTLQLASFFSLDQYRRKKFYDFRREQRQEIERQSRELRDQEERIVRNQMATMEFLGVSIPDQSMELE